MSKFLDWEANGDGTIRVAAGPTPKPKKLTGSRLGAVVGLNKWKSPFEAWCEACRVGEQPFEGNKFTEAGNVIESKLIEWCRTEVSPYVYSPEEFYGVTDAKQHTGYDFYDHPIFGGMWDAVVLDRPDGNTISLVECKTSSRPQDWANGVPESYAVQVLMYAILSGVTRVFVPVALLEPGDYDDPASFVCTDDNTFLYELDVETWTDSDGRSIRTILDDAQGWWMNHVVGNVSPTFDVKGDKAILAVIGKREVKTEELEQLAKHASVLEAKIEAVKAASDLAALERELKKVKDQLKTELVKQFTGKDDTVTAYGWKVKHSVKETVDTDALKADGLGKKYITVEDTYRLGKDNAKE